MTNLLDGKAMALQIKEEIAGEVRQLTQQGHRAPHLAAVIVGEDGASMTYVANKEKSSKEVGFTSSVYRMSEKTTDFGALGKIVSAAGTASGTYEHTITLGDVLPSLTIWGQVGADNFGRTDGCKISALNMSVTGNEPATFSIETAGKHCVVLGRSNIVGTPAANLLSRKGFDCTVTMCHSKTQNLAELTRQADILVVAIGKPEFVTADMVKEGAVLVDVGIHRVPDATKKNGYRVIGDVKHSEVDAKCSWTTPVPGGVGPLTIVSLLENTLKAYKRR